MNSVSQGLLRRGGHHDTNGRRGSRRGLLIHRDGVAVPQARPQDGPNALARAGQCRRLSEHGGWDAGVVALRLRRWDRPELPRRPDLGLALVVRAGVEDNRRWEVVLVPLLLDIAAEGVRRRRGVAVVHAQAARHGVRLAARRRRHDGRSARLGADGPPPWRRHQRHAAGRRREALKNEPLGHPHGGGPLRLAGGPVQGWGAALDAALEPQVPRRSRAIVLLRRGGAADSRTKDGLRHGCRRAAGAVGGGKKVARCR